MRLRAQMGPLLHLNAAKTLNLMVLKSLQLRCSARGGLLKKMSHNGDGSNLARFVTNPRGATITWTLGPKIESLPPPPPRQSTLHQLDTCPHLGEMLLLILVGPGTGLFRCTVFCIEETD